VPLTRHRAADWLARPPDRGDLGGTAEQREAVRAICARVAAEGDAALWDLGRRFDGWAPAAGESLALGREPMRAALAGLPPPERAALELAAARIRAFHEAQRYEDITGPEGLQLLVRPVGRAGLYVPGGRAAYPSTVLMTGIPARVAGVREVLLATPPGADGSVPPAVLAAAALAGVDRVFRVGGAQAVAAFAHGTESVPRVDVVAGPGSVYVTLAKREVFGLVGVDAVAGGPRPTSWPPTWRPSWSTTPWRGRCWSRTRRRWRTRWRRRSPTSRTGWTGRRRCGRRAAASCWRSRRRGRWTW